MIVTVAKRVRWYFPNGRMLCFEPGRRYELSDKIAAEVNAKLAGTATITVHSFHDWRDTPHQADAPIPINAWIVFRQNGQLCGGPEDGDLGQVAKCVWHDGQWRVFTYGNLIVAEKQIVGVSVVNDAGELIAAWTTRGHGLDGASAPRPQLCDLNPAQQQQVMDRYGWTPEELHALATGIWSPEVWASFWRGGSPL